MSVSTVGRAVARELPGGVSVRAPAKLNLSLAVLARRADGYHDIESLIVPVTLHDTVEVRAGGRPGIRLRVRFAGGLATATGSVLATDVPADATNLALRAAAALAAEAGIETDSGAGPGLDISLTKRIPAGSGLGGGSSDAAATLVAAARAWGVDWSLERLATIGSRIGSDVPVFFAGGAAIVGGRGERIDPVPNIPALHAVIARPAAGLSTAAVYSRCTPDAARKGDAARLAAALAAGRLRGSLPLFFNALEPPARSLSPEIDRLLDAFSRAGGLHPMLTGSGSACFSLARSATEARLVAARLRAAGWPGVYRVRLETAAG